MGEKRYESFTRMGECMICKTRSDLRMGACFSCSDKVAGAPMYSSSGELRAHKLWEASNPANTWIVPA